MRNHHASSVLIGDYLYGFSDAILTAMKFDTGQVAWRDRSVGKGSMVFADDRLYLYSEQGVVGLAEANPAGYREHGRFQIQDRKRCRHGAIPLSRTASSSFGIRTTSTPTTCGRDRSIPHPFRPARIKIGHNERMFNRSQESSTKGRQNVLADTRLKIAVFIDFDNIEIGVKSTLGVQFDIGVVLEALRERGDVVSKIAYGDWTRAGDYSRSLTQHATKLVQRNLTPGGDKNGADINLALDALEMAFTHGHINAYVIVGGDSDFITLVEKLKQYDKQIFVVGGRAFTSLVMQRNCHEFIAYENLVGTAPIGRSRTPERAGRVAGVHRAGGAAGAARAEGADRSRSVAAARAAQEHAAAARLDVLRADVRRRQLPGFRAEAGVGGPRRPSRIGAQRARRARRRSQRRRRGARAAAATAAHVPVAVSEDQVAPQEAASSNGSGAEPRTADGIREVRRLFQSAQNRPRWPMYIRQAKQFLRNVDASFDERKFGFASLVDLLARLPA